MGTKKNKGPNFSQYSTPYLNKLLVINNKISGLCVMSEREGEEGREDPGMRGRRGGEKRERRGRGVIRKSKI
jgi:hypothetical protein